MTGTANTPVLLSHRATQSRSSVIRELLKLTEQPHILSLAGGLPNPAGFPIQEIRKAAQRLLDPSGETAAKALQYGPTEGVEQLRHLVAEHFNCPATGVIITTGSQQALDLIGRTLIDPGDVVVVESPSYVGAMQAFNGWDPQLVGIPGDRHGLRTDLLEERLRHGLEPKFVYVVANFSNPSGATLSDARRVHLADLADRFGFVIVEDDPYGELRWEGTEPAPLRARSERVISLGTASKILAPGLRVGWAAMPQWLVDPFVRAKQGADLHTSTLNQYLAYELLSDVSGQRARLGASVARYQQQAMALHSALVSELGSAIDVAPAAGGMFLWARMTADFTDTEILLQRAIEHGVAFVPGSAFFVPDQASMSRDYLRLSFATLDPDSLAEAARRLKAAVESFA